MRGVVCYKNNCCHIYSPAENWEKNQIYLRFMKYTVGRGGIRLLGRTVHSLAKIGDDIYIEPQADSLTLRAVNSSR